MSLNLKNLNITCSPMYNSQNTNEIFGYVCSTNNKTVEGFQSVRPLSGIVADPKTTPIRSGVWNSAFNNKPCSILYNVSLDWQPLTMVGVLNSENKDQIYLFQNENTIVFYDTYSWNSFYYTGTVPPIGSTLDLSQVGEIKVAGANGNTLTLVSSTMRFLVAPMTIQSLGITFKNPPFYPGYLYGNNINNGTPLAILNVLKNVQILNVIKNFSFSSISTQDGISERDKANRLINYNNMNYTYVTFDGINTILYDVNSGVTYSYKGYLINSNKFYLTEPDFGQTTPTTFDLLNPDVTNLGANYCSYSDYSETQFGVISVSSQNDCYIDSNNNLFPCTATGKKVSIHFSKSTVADLSCVLAQFENTVKFMIGNNSYSYIGTMKVGDIIDLADPKITKETSNLTYISNSQKINIINPSIKYYLNGGDLSAQLPVIGYATTGTNRSDTFYFVQDGFNIKFLKIAFVIGSIPNPAYNPPSHFLGSGMHAKLSLRKYKETTPPTIPGPTTVVASISAYSLPGILGNTIYLVDPRIKQLGTTITNPDMTQTYPNMYNLTT